MSARWPRGLAIVDGQKASGLFADEERFPGELASLIGAGQDALAVAGSALRKGAAINLDAVDYLPPPVDRSGKIMCVGLNFRDHAKEAKMDVPRHPNVFARFASSLVGHRAKLVRPKMSTQFDYEGELAVVIGRYGRHIPEAEAMAYVAGYSIINDASVRDFQLETSQWTVGKNFDGTGAFGPYFVTAEEVPPGGVGLRLATRLNGAVVQDGSTDDMIFSVVSTISFLSQAMTLEPGDVLVMGTPPGVGMGRLPQLFMKPGDVCEVEIEGLSVLRNTVAAEVRCIPRAHRPKHWGCFD